MFEVNNKYIKLNNNKVNNKNEVKLNKKLGLYSLT